jgi:hypothetical protein
MARWTVAVLALPLLLLSPARALEPLTRVIAQPGSPVRITAYGAAYQEGAPNSPEGIRHTVAYENAGDRAMAAVEISLVSFDVWNEFLDRTAGVTLRDLVPGAADKRTWVVHVDADFTFQTGIAFVSRVRFVDGTFWAGDLRAVGTELKKVQKDFDVAKLDHKASKR